MVGRLMDALLVFHGTAEVLVRDHGTTEDFYTKASSARDVRVLMKEGRSQPTRLQQDKPSHLEATEENKATLSVTR